MTSLHILKKTSCPTNDALVRHLHQTAMNWTRHLAEDALLDFGTAWSNPQLSRVHQANRMLDVALPPGTTPLQAFEAAGAHFGSQGAICWQWVMNPSASLEQTAPAVAFLISQGYRRVATDILYLDHLPGGLIPGTRDELRIIPARASFKHTRMLHEESAQQWHEPQVAEAAMLHLDDPHYDALIAIKDGAAVAHVGVLAVGEIGLIEELFVSAPFRRRGVGTTMMGRALEICARSLFKQILTAAAPDNAPAQRLYQRFGFRKIGELIEYQKPS